MERLKRNLILALGLGVAVYLALAVFSGLDDLRAAMSDLRWSLLPAVFGLVALSYVGRYLRWVYYLRVLKVHVPHRANAAIFAAGLSMTISPGKLGEVLKSVFVRRVSGAPVARTAPAVFAERITDGTGMLVWGLLGALAFSFGIGLLLVFSALAVVGVAVLRSERLSRLAEKTLSRVPVLARFAPHLRDFHGASNELLSTRPLVIGTSMSFFAWGFECLGVYLCSVAVGAELDFLLVIFIFAVSSIAGSMSMLPGGIGAAEIGLAGGFVAFAELSKGLAGALTFLIRLATLWFATLIGIAGLMLVRAALGDPDELPATPKE
jgi:uncharacterized protein (TIRG00374 family)